MKLTIITPFYNEELGIKNFFKEVLCVIENCKIDNYEIICIDDGSTDNTFNILKDIYQKNNNIKVIKLSRNFGKEKALSAGLNYATGDIIIPMDADLQHPPKLIPKMIEQYELGFDVVLMKRRSRNESFFKKKTAKLFYKIIKFLANNSIPEDVGDFRLISKKCLDAVNQMQEKTRFMKGILSWPGFKTTTLMYDQPNRSVGEAKQSLSKLIALALNGIFSFSSFPLRVWTYIGCLTTLSSFLFGIWIIIHKIVIKGYAISGYSSTLIIIIFLNGVLMLNIGILGEYVSRIYDEVKQRPLYIIDEFLSKPTKK